MDITVGTFNLNNLFSRYNFSAELEAIREGDTEIETVESFVFAEPFSFVVRKFLGKLVKAKDEAKTKQVASRILEMDLDVLAVQEVEDIGTLRAFNLNELGGLYPYQILIEGNDARLIDLGLLSKYPIGAVSSWQQAVHPEEPGRFVFSRDLLEVDILNRTRTRKLFTLFNNHLKSHFVRWQDDQVEGQQRNNARRQRQAETVARIVAARTRPNSSFIVLGDMNDPPDSGPLEPLVTDPELNLVNALSNPVETTPPKSERPPSVTPDFSAWTHRFKESGEPAEFELYDQIWLSPALAAKQTGAFIHRRINSVDGDGSDHDPAWVTLNL